MTEEEIEENDEINEIKHSQPVIDFIETMPVQQFELHGKTCFIQY